MGAALNLGAGGDSSVSQKWMSRRWWDDAELDAHQFAADRLFSALDQITEQIGQINEIMRDIGDTNERLVRGDPLPPPNMN